MKHKRHIQPAWGLLLATLLLGLSVTPTYAAKQGRQHIDYRLNSTSINATVYLPTAALQPIFQSRIDQQVPNAVNSAINGIVNNLPAADRGWALQMATTLIQPSASLTRLVPQQGGIATSLYVSLYPGDPQPIGTSMLIQFSVMDSTTVQVSARPINGSPALVNGPITTFQIPIGQLSSIKTTPGCGNSALALNLRLPVSLGQGSSGTSTAVQQGQGGAPAGLDMISQPELKRDATSVSSYVEIPSSSLASLGDSIGVLPISSDLSAQNIQVAVSGSDLIIQSDIILGSSFKLGTAVTTVEPTAVNGSLAVHVLSTTLTVFQIFTFPYNTYNQQIEQTLNDKLNSALAGKFNVTSAAIGANSHVPCVAGDSLVLTGTTGLV